MKARRFLSTKVASTPCSWGPIPRTRAAELGGSIEAVVLGTTGCAGASHGRLLLLRPPRSWFSTAWRVGDDSLQGQRHVREASQHRDPHRRQPACRRRRNISVFLEDMGVHTTRSSGDSRPPLLQRSADGSWSSGTASKATGLPSGSHGASERGASTTPRPTARSSVKSLKTPSYRAEPRAAPKELPAPETRCTHDRSQAHYSRVLQGSSASVSVESLQRFCNASATLLQRFCNASSGPLLDRAF